MVTHRSSGTNRHEILEMRMSGKSEIANNPTRWELWRQDDNGVRVLIAGFEDQEAASEALARFESRHHKQTYWIEETGAA